MDSEAAVQRAYALRPHLAVIGFTGVIVNGICAVGYNLEVVRSEVVPVIGGGIRFSPVLAYSTAGVRTSSVSGVKEYLHEAARQIAGELANAIRAAQAN